MGRRRGALLLLIAAAVVVSSTYARVADRGRVVEARKERSRAADKMNSRVGRTTRDDEDKEGYYGKERNEAVDERRTEAAMKTQETGLRSRSNDVARSGDPVLMPQPASGGTVGTLHEDEYLPPEEFERKLSSQLTGCCTTYKSYSASTLCSMYGQDCSSGQEPSHDSGDEDCSQEGLSFIGISFSVLTAKGNPYSYQLCDQFPMENIIDRNYDYVMSMDEDGWLVGGGYKSFDYSGKMPYIDSSHTELLRIGSIDPEYGGTTIQQVYSAMSALSFPPFSIFPEYVKGGGGHHSGSGDSSSSVPSGDVTLIVSVVEEYEDNENYSTYELFLDDLFNAMDSAGGGTCMDDHDTDPHVSMSRGVKFKSSYHQQQYFYKANLEVAVWQAMYPSGVVIGSSSTASFPPDQAYHNRQTVGYGNLYFFFDRANITKAFPPNRELTSTESYYSTLYNDGGADSYYSSVTSINFDYSGSGSGDNDDEYYEHNPYGWNALMAKHDMTDGWDLPPSCEQEGESFFGIPLSKTSDSKLQTTTTFQEQFDFDLLTDRNFTYMKKFGTNHGWLVGEQVGNGAGSIVDKDTAHIPIFYTGTTNPEMGGMSLSNVIKIAKEIDFGTLYIKPAFVFQDDDASIKLQFEADSNSALAYLYDNLCKLIGIAWNYDKPSNNLGVYTNCAMHAAGDRAKYGCGPDNGNSGGFCPQMTLAYSVGFQSEEYAAAYMSMANTYVDYWRSLYPSGVAVGTSKFCKEGGCLGLFLNRYDLYEVFKPDLAGSWVEYNGGTFPPTISPAPTWSGGCDNPHNRHLDKCFRKHHKRKATAAAWDSLGTVGQLSIFLLTFMATTLAISIFLTHASRRKRKGESYVGFFIRDLKRRKKRKKKLRKKGRSDLEEDMLAGSIDEDAYKPPPPPRPGKAPKSKPASRSRSRSKTRRHSSRAKTPRGRSGSVRRGGESSRRSRSRSRSVSGRSRSRSASRRAADSSEARSARSVTSKRRQLV